MNKLINAVNEIKVELQNSNLKKTGKNKFAKFNYFELTDFLPTLNTLMKKHGVLDVFEQTEDSFKLHLYHGDAKVTHSLRYENTAEHSKQIKGIQWLGSEQTYFRRYLYMAAFGISENDVIDNISGNANKRVNKAIVPKPDKEPVKTKNASENTTQTPENDISEWRSIFKHKVGEYCSKNEGIKPADVYATYKLNANSDINDLRQACARLDVLLTGGQDGSN